MNPQQIAQAKLFLREEQEFRKDVAKGAQKAYSKKVFFKAWK